MIIELRFNYIFKNFMEKKTERNKFEANLDIILKRILY